MYFSSFTFLVILSLCFYTWVLSAECFVCWLWINSERTKSRSLHCYCCWCQRLETGIREEESFSNVWRSTSIKYCKSFMYFRDKSSWDRWINRRINPAVFCGNVSFFLLVLPKFLLRAASFLVNVCMKLKWKWSVCFKSHREREKGQMLFSALLNTVNCLSAALWEIGFLHLQVLCVRDEQ